MARAEWILGSAWRLMFVVAVLIALPVVVLGEVSANDARARLRQTQIDSAVRAADLVAVAYEERLSRLASTLEALGLSGRAEQSAVGGAIIRGDATVLQSLVDSVQRANAATVLRVYVATRPEAGVLADATVAAASPLEAGLVGKKFADLPGNPQLLGMAGSTTAARRGQIGDFYLDSVGFAGQSVIATLTRASSTAVNTGTGTVTNPTPLPRDQWAVIVAQVDVPRMFAEVAEPALAAGDDAYLISTSGELVARVRAVVSPEIADLSGDRVVYESLAQVRGVRLAPDPLGGGERLIANVRLFEELGSAFSPVPTQLTANQRSGGNTRPQLLIVRDISAATAALESVLGQLAGLRYGLVVALLLGSVLVARATATSVRQRREIALASGHKSQFLAGMSHELRTPLNSIIGFSEVLLERIAGDLNAKQEDYLRDILSSGKHQLALINDILDLQKIEAGKLELNPHEFDLRETLAAAHRSVIPLAQAKRQQLLLVIDDEVGPAVLDESRVRQVLLNLLSNAVKYTPDGGAITMHASASDGAVAIAVTDTGVGIDAKDQESVFEEFERVGTGYSGEQQGTGLGLALARRFARLMGGDIELRSELGRGSTFTVKLPLADH